MKATVLATIGPAVSDCSIFKKLASLVNGIRINTTYGTIDEHAKIIDFIRKNSELPIVLDIKGPELRIRLENPMQISANSIFELGFSEKNSFSYDFSSEAKKDDIVLFDDGKLKAKIVSLSSKTVIMRAKNFHVLKNMKNACIPKRKLKIPQLSAKDLAEIKLANEKKIEYVALSFTRNAADVENLRKKLDKNIHIIGKIENEDGLHNIDEIIENVNGIMVARGDLALEIGQEKVPLAQKEIVRKCNTKGKLSIIATQVLETMVGNPYPTRAEISDIANAVLDGGDGIMLSGETSIGKHPLEAVKIVHLVAKEMENSISAKVSMDSYENISDVISKSIYAIAKIMNFDSIVSITRSGYTARMISRFRLKNKIIAATPNECVRKQLALYFGIEPIVIPEFPEANIIFSVAKFLYSRKLLKINDSVLFTAGIRTKQKHASNLIEVHKISDLLNKSSI